MFGPMTVSAGWCVSPWFDICICHLTCLVQLIWGQRVGTDCIFLLKHLNWSSVNLDCFPTNLNINDDKDGLCEGKEGSEPGDDVADDVADHPKVRAVRALRVIEQPGELWLIWKLVISRYIDDEDKEYFLLMMIVTWGRQPPEFHRYQEQWQKWSV